jgi:hypothetical protein
MHLQTRPRCSVELCIMYRIGSLTSSCVTFSLSPSPHICMPMCDSSHRIPTTPSLGNFQIIIKMMTAPRLLQFRVPLFRTATDTERPTKSTDRFSPTRFSTRGTDSTPFETCRMLTKTGRSSIANGTGWRARSPPCVLFVFHAALAPLSHCRVFHSHRPHTVY